MLNDDELKGIMEYWGDKTTAQLVNRRFTAQYSWKKAFETAINRPMTEDEFDATKIHLTAVWKLVV